MRHITAIIVLPLAFVIACSVVWADDTQIDSAGLSKQIDDLRQQMQEMKEQYEGRIDALEQRIEELEAGEDFEDAAEEFEAALEEDLAPEEAVAPSQPQAAPSSTAGFSWPDLRGRPAGVQRMNPDIGVVIDTLGRWVDDELPDDEDANRWKLREGELIFTGYVDPFAKLTVSVSGHEEDVEIEEGHAELLELPFNTRARVGKFLLPYGILNQYHEHDLPQVDRPLALAEFFGDHMADEGIELSWLLPNPWDMYSELIISYTNGDEIGEIETSPFRPDAILERDWFEDEMVVGRWANFFELSDRSSLLVGLNAAKGVNRGNEDTDVLFGGADAKYRYTWPDHRKLTLQCEQIWWDEESRFYFLDPANQLAWLDEDIAPHGGYAYAEYEFIPKRWAIGSRADWVGHRQLFDPRITDDKDMTYGGSAYVTFMPSEFQRWRLQYRHIDYDFGFADEDTDEIMLQASFILGFHPAHKF